MGAEQLPLGLVLFEGDPVSAPTMQQLLDPMGIDVHPTRIGFPPANSDMSAFAEMLRVAAATILPSAAPRVIGFACTTGAIQLGANRLRAAVSRPGVSIEPVTPIDGVIAALDALGAGRVAIVSPYAEAVSAQVARHIEGRGFAVSHLSSFDAGNADIPAISAERIVDAARGACASDKPDALFLSCTGMRATPLIAVLEAELGIPVLTSLQVMAWRAAVLLSIRPQGTGRLFEASVSPAR